MKPLPEILRSIEFNNNRYRTLKLADTHTQSDILRDLSCAFIDLTMHKIEARNLWMNIYNKAEGTNASKEREADTEVMELSLIRDVLKAVGNQMDSIRSTLSANKAS